MRWVLVLVVGFRYWMIYPFALTMVSLLISSVFLSSACAQSIQSLAAASLAATPPVDSTVQASTRSSIDSPGVQYALIIAGLGGEQKYIDQNHTWSADLHKSLVSDHGFAEDRVFLLVEDPNAVFPAAARKSNLKEIRRIFSFLADSMNPSDDLFILLIGHGSVRGGDARLNIPGPDLNTQELGDVLAKLHARYIIVVNGASSSAPFIAALSREDRVIVTATKSARERLATVFPEHFVASLQALAGDLNKDGRVSVLEAFIYARNKTASWYDEQGLLATEHPLFDDNGDGIGVRRPENEDSEGELAGRVYFGRVEAKSVVSDSPEQRRLRAQLDTLRMQIDKLKASKDQIRSEEYTQRMESMLIEFARVSSSLRSAEPAPD